MATENNNSFVQLAIPRFDGHYNHWAMLMENFLRSKEYWESIENGIPATVDRIEPTKAQRRPEIERFKGQELSIPSYRYDYY